MKGSTLYGKKLPGLQCDGYENMKDGKSKSSPFQNLKGDQHKIDKNKDGKISKADFDMMDKSPLEGYGKKKK